MNAMKHWAQIRAKGRSQVVVECCCCCGLSCMKRHACWRWWWKCRLNLQTKASRPLWWWWLHIIMTGHDTLTWQRVPGLSAVLWLCLNSACLEAQMCAQMLHCVSAAGALWTAVAQQMVKAKLFWWGSNLSSFYLHEFLFWESAGKNGKTKQLEIVINCSSFACM